MMNLVRSTASILLFLVGLSSASRADNLPVRFLGPPAFETQRLFDDQRYPNVVVTTNGTVLAVWGNDGVVVRRSEDGGKSWGPAIPVANAGYHGGGTIVDGNSGDILVFVEDRQPPAPLTVYRSRDEGKSWQAQSTTIEKDQNGNSPSMHMNEHGVTLTRGLHKGRLIRPTRYYGPKGGQAEWPQQYANAIYSDDGGITWKTSKPFPENGTGEAALVELADGRLYYNSRVHWPERPRNRRRREAWSDDGGASWKNWRIVDALPDGDQGRTYGCMGGLTRLHLKERDILIFSNLDTDAPHRERVTVWASFDGGKTWPVKRLVDAGRSGYSSLAVGRPETPSAGWVYLHYEHDPFKGAHLARFNLAWVLGGEATGDGEVPGRIGFQNLNHGGSPVPSRETRIKALAPDVSSITGGAEPFFEVWKEDNVYGVLDVALDGTILLFSLQGDPHPDKRRGSSIYLKRSEDGGATWSEHQLIGKRIDLDWKALGIGPYDGSGWGKDKHHAFATLCTSVVDENTGEIMFFLGALYPAPYMYKSRDHGRTWNLEKIDFKKDSRGFLSVPNAACDPGITIRQGPHKGRLLVPSRVIPNYNKHEEAKGYTSAVYSDDHGKTWMTSEPFPLDGTGESGLVELSDGTIYFNSRTHTRKGNRWIAYSDDTGETWRGLHQDKVLFDGPPDEYGCKAGLLRLDRDDSDILLFSSPTAHLPGRENIRVWVSFDGGKTWPHNRLIKRGPGNYTWMTEGRKGTPGEGFIYLLSGKDWMARFNMAWLLQPDYGPAGLEGDYQGHVQGIAADGRGNLFWSHTYSIIKTDNEGKVQRKVSVAGHAGDVCYVEGKLYCAFNFGEFNQEPGKADSWVWVFDTESLKVLEKHEVSQAVHGAGGITFHDGHFYVVGGLPENHQQNYVYQYDPDFKFVKRHILKSGHTHLGIQTAAFAHGSFWFGCYGDPPQLLKCDPELRKVERFQFDASFGIEALHDGGLLVCPNDDPVSRQVHLAEPSDKTGVEFVPDLRRELEAHE